MPSDVIKTNEDWITKRLLILLGKRNFWCLVCNEKISHNEATRHYDNCHKDMRDKIREIVARAYLLNPRITTKKEEPQIIEEDKSSIKDDAIKFREYTVTKMSIAHISHTKITTILDICDTYFKLARKWGQRLDPIFT
ncbi:hypothetical protein EIN_105120 [Entamoeba invadens IP1]|uniref:Uncharacterized protein n=1 Tax=Entamoeba invadens IP1 TaxID=370355 RepID=L7FLK1_ENTIV|nr:hypothetical protein EIN_105120 [Entamoeba invadens IP1]ELP88749.1 hypothetical protein EIN_105120 [Entamoeba invadens IP1]|eukprot:XP_004255520.1 hypothetical protein EIN_105120 [Entamoeba invadens IP1]